MQRLILIKITIVTAVTVYFLIFVWLFARALFNAFGVYSFWPVIITELLVVMFVFTKIIKHTATAKQKAKKAETGLRGVDFMTNRATTQRKQPLNERVIVSKPEKTDDFLETTISNIVWRYKQTPRRVTVLGAFCSKCGNALTAVKTAQNWQADLKCLSCGKSFISLPGEDPDGKTRTFEKTKKLVARIINARTSKIKA